MFYLQLKLHLLFLLQVMKLSAISFSSSSAWGQVPAVLRMALFRDLLHDLEESDNLTIALKTTQGTPKFGNSFAEAVTIALI